MRSVSEIKFLKPNICYAHVEVDFGESGSIQNWRFNFYIITIYSLILALCGYLIVSILDIIVQIESHIKRLDEDLGQFAEDLKHGISNYGRF